MSKAERERLHVLVQYAEVVRASQSLVAAHRAGSTEDGLIAPLLGACVPGHAWAEGARKVLSSFVGKGWHLHKPPQLATVCF